MKLRTIKRACVMYLVNHVFTGTRCFSAKARLLRSLGHEIGEGTKVVGPLFCTGRLVIGKDCWLGADLRLYGSGTVFIGDGCDLAPGITFLTGSHELGNHQRRAGKGFNGDIRIENGCWIGGNATILAKTHVGVGSVVAACACVVGDVPADTLVGGVPAKKIRELEP